MVSKVYFLYFRHRIINIYRLPSTFVWTIEIQMALWLIFFTHIFIVLYVFNFNFAYACRIHLFTIYLFKMNLKKQFKETIKNTNINDMYYLKCGCYISI